MNSLDKEKLPWATFLHNSPLYFNPFSIVTAVIRVAYNPYRLISVHLYTYICMCFCYGSFKKCERYHAICIFVHLAFFFFFLILFNEIICHVPWHGCIIFFKNHFPIDRYLGSFHFFLSIEKYCNKHSCECLIGCTWEQFSGIDTQEWNCWAQGLSQVLSEATGGWGRCGWVVGSRWLVIVGSLRQAGGGSGLCLIAHSRWP